MCSPACTPAARRRCRSRSGRPAVAGCRTTQRAASAQCDRTRWSSPCAPDWWCSWPTPAASSTWTSDSCRPLSRKSSSRCPAWCPHRPGAGASGSDASRATRFASAWWRTPSPSSAWCCGASCGRVRPAGGWRWHDMMCGRHIRAFWRVLRFAVWRHWWTEQACRATAAACTVPTSASRSGWRRSRAQTTSGCSRSGRQSTGAVSRIFCSCGRRLHKNDEIIMRF